MSNEQFDNRIRQKLESVRPNLDPNAWKRFRGLLPQPWYLKLWNQYGAWLYGGLITAGLLGSLTVLYRNNQQIKTLHDEITTLKHQVVQIPQRPAVPAVSAKAPLPTDEPLTPTLLVPARTQPVSTVAPVPRVLSAPVGEGLVAAIPSVSPKESEVRSTVLPLSEPGTNMNEPALMIKKDKDTSTRSAAPVLPSVEPAKIPESPAIVPLNEVTLLTGQPLVAAAKATKTTPKRKSAKNKTELSTPAEAQKQIVPNQVSARSAKRSAQNHQSANTQSVIDTPRKVRLTPQKDGQKGEPMLEVPAPAGSVGIRADTLTQRSVSEATQSQDTTTVATPPNTHQGASTPPESNIKLPSVSQSVVRLRLGAEALWSKPTPLFGPAIELFLGKQLSFSTGVLVARPLEVMHREPRDFNRSTGKDFKEFYRNKVPPNDRIEEIQVRTSMVKLPLNFKYYVPLKHNVALVVSAGTILDLSVRQRVRFESFFQGIEQTNSFEQKVPPRNFHNFTLGLGVEYRWKSVVGQVSPYFDFCFSECDYQPKSNLLGLRTSLWLNLSK